MTRRIKLGLGLIAVVALVVGTLTTQAGGAGQFTDNYAVKFACGEFGKFLQPTPPATIEGPVKPGNYQTIINVHNPQQVVPANFRKKAILMYSAPAPFDETVFEQPRGPGQILNVNLPPDFGMFIDCQDIREVLLPGSPAAPIFIEGWVVILVDGSPPLPLDVTALYTSHGFNCRNAGCTAVLREGFSENVERIVATRVTG